MAQGEMTAGFIASVRYRAPARGQDKAILVFRIAVLGSFVVRCKQCIKGGQQYSFASCMCFSQLRSSVNINSRRLEFYLLHAFAIGMCFSWRNDGLDIIRDMLLFMIPLVYFMVGRRYAK